MKRKFIIAATAAVVLAGGTYTAFAAAGADPVPASEITAAEALEAALAKKAGTVESVGREDDDRGHWEVELRTADGRSHEFHVDAGSGKVSPDRDDDRDDRDDRDDADSLSAARAKVDARQAADAALAFRGGTITEIDFDGSHWEVEIVDKGAEHEVRVDAQSGTASAMPAERHDDRDDD
jgi:uncharacterized membrane protein YkoI